MIYTGKWVYKKYKNRQARKEELNASAQAKHGELIVASEDEIFKTAVEDLGDLTPATQESDYPPSYTKMEQHSLIPTQRTLHTSLSAKSMISSPDRTFQETCESTEAPLASLFSGQKPNLVQHYLPNDTSILSPQSSLLGINGPDEIEVHGKWIWVPDDRPLQNHPGYTPGIELAAGMNEADRVGAERHAGECLAELSCDPRELGTLEKDQSKGVFPAELDGTELPFDKFEERSPYTVRGK